MSTTTTDRPLRRPHYGRRPLPPTASRLLGTARAALDDAVAASDAPERYAAAHLAALRGAAAVLADRARPADTVVARRPTSAWTLLTAIAPELAEWATYFAAGAGTRAAAEAGLRSAVTPRAADDLLRDAETFLALVETTLGVFPGSVVSSSALPSSVVPSETIAPRRAG